jgi:putative transcriptional regulator|tara:strand:+ start:2246 stop:2800 length:555 start_codon:yes stop_codon:yes gene_type:complete
MRTSITGSKWQNKILISTPKMGQDSTFARSVVFVYEESPQHVAGLVINKPTRTKLKKILESKGFATVDMKDLVYQGGPVNQESILLLHTDEWSCKNTLKLGNGFSLTSDAQMLKKLHEEDSPDEWRCFSGLSVWSPGQLEGEINSKCWLTAEPSEELLLNTPIEQIYEKAIKICSEQTFNKYID